MNEQIVEASASMPTKVCAKCSVQSQTTGDFCPHCGHNYVRQRRKPSPRVIVAVVIALLLVAAAVTGMVLKVRADRDQEREQAVAAKADAAADAAEEAAAREEARQRRLDAQAAADRAERRSRQSLIRQMQNSITKDAQKRVARGELEGPIYYTSCDPLGGGSVDDLTALTTTFECIAVNEKLGGGQVRGWVFSSTANWDKASWSWHLGR